MKKFLFLLDPYRQSFLFFHWNFYFLLTFAAAVIWLTLHMRGAFVSAILDNIFIYFPNYLIHEFSHRFWCMFGEYWWCYASGNGMETLVPLALCVWALHLRGGRYLLPPLLYWLASTLYAAGIYAADARASALPLTSSDMMTNYAPGEIKGDWHYILQPLGLLDYDVFIGNILMFLGVFFLVIAIWSVWYYWIHMKQYINHGQWY